MRKGSKNIAFDGTNFLVVWNEDGSDTEIRGRFVSPTGNLGTEFSINASTYPSDNPMSVSFDGTNYLVVWTDEVSTGEWDVFGQIVTPFGTLSGSVISISTAAGPQVWPFIAFDGSNYLVTWTDMGNDANKNWVCDAGEGTCLDIYGQYISKAGALVGSEFVINNDAGDQVGGVGGFNNGKYLVIVNEGSGGSGELCHDPATGQVSSDCDVYGVFVTPSDTSNIWTVKTSMPTARAMLTSGMVNGKIYAIGGILGDNTTVGTVEAYDTATNTWATKASMPTPRRLLASGVVNGKIYAIGGALGDNTTVGTVEEYDPATNTWATKASMPTPRSNITGAVVSGKIYVIGGFMTGTVEEYDPATNTWATKASMPTAREGLTSAVVNGKIYAIGGGSRAGDNSIISLAIVEEYDPATNTWATKASMPTARGEGLTSALVNGKIYAIGGFTGTTALSTVEEYDPVTNTWATKASMPTARYHLTSGEVSGKIYAMGGSDGASVLSMVEAYTP